MTAALPPQPHRESRANCGADLERNHDLPAIHKKCTTYPELVDSPQLKLVVAAMETGGRLNAQALELLDQAAAAKSRQAPIPLQPYMARVWRARWVAI